MHRILSSADMVGILSRVLGPHMAPLLLEAAHQRCGLFLQDQEPAPFAVPAMRPWVVVIGDDPAMPATSLGPRGFHAGSLASLLRAAADVSLISCEIKPEIYERQAVLAVAGFSGVIVETRAEHEDAWLAFLAIVAPGKVRNVALVGSEWRATR